jgi:hypothetical protein
MTDPVPNSIHVESSSSSSKNDSKKRDKKSKKGSSSKKSGSSSSSSSKKSGVRTKFLLESLRQDYYTLQDENNRLRDIILSRLPNAANAILAECCPPRKKVSSIDELGAMMPNMTIEEGDEEEEDDDDEE